MARSVALFSKTSREIGGFEFVEEPVTAVGSAIEGFRGVMSAMRCQNPEVPEKSRHTLWVWGSKRFSIAEFLS